MKVFDPECLGAELWALDVKGVLSFVGMSWSPVTRYPGRCNSIGTINPA